ncbi:MAG: shikimate kinase [Egibacteraceae bacterium]
MILAPGRNLVLIGMMGSGKTVVGQLVAAQLQRPHVDTDALIEAEARMTIVQLFETEGERAFRAREAEAIRWVSALRGQVLSVGGGAVVHPANVTALRATGDLVLLHAEVAELARRLAACENRPLIKDHGDLVARLEQLRPQREGAYRRAAAHTIDTTGRTPKEVAGAVLAWARTQPGLLTRDEREP